MILDYLMIIGLSAVIAGAIFWVAMKALEQDFDQWWCDE